MSTTVGFMIAFGIFVLGGAALAAFAIWLRDSDQKERHEAGASVVTNRDQLRWAAGTLDMLAAKIAEAGDDDATLVRAHGYARTAFGLLRQMLVATDEHQSPQARAAAFHAMDEQRERIEHLLSKEDTHDAC